MNILNAKLEFAPLQKRSKTGMVILHHVAGNGSVEQIHDYHKRVRGWSGIGYHFYVRKDGSVWQGRPIDAVGAHTLGYNSDSVAVCFEGNFETEQMNGNQASAGAELVAYIRDKYPSVTKVKGHGELKNTACPGKNFPYDKILAPKMSENKIKSFQLAAIADGFKLQNYGADGVWGKETEAVAKKAVCKRRLSYKYKQLTRIVQKTVGVTVDGKYGAKTKSAVIAYQLANKLVPDGEWGINCWKHYLEVT